MSSGFIPVDSPFQQSHPKSESAPAVTVTPDNDSLYQAMVVSSNIALPQTVMMEMYKNPHISNRRHCVEWIRKVLNNESVYVRDSTVRIFDTYLAMSLAENPLILKDTSFTAFSAVASMILSSKLYSSTKYLSPTFFSVFQLEDILFFERQILLKTGSRMSALASPSYYVDYIVALCPETVEKDLLQQMVNIIVGEFWEDGASLLFAPSTIAVSAVILSFSLKKMDCSKLVDSLPEFLLPNRSYPFFLEEDGKSMYLDLNTCMKAMERLPYVRATYMTKSPTSIADQLN